MDNSLLINKIVQLPENLKSEVNDFIDFLLTKKNENGKSKKPQFGSGKGTFIMQPDFEDPLDDFNEYI
jgi:hypothetical protein